jgi:choline dehydrogenase-like flavoprotein
VSARARDLDPADVLVIGAGASGAVVTRHLAARGFHVTCLEQGGWVNASEYAGDKPEWELYATQRWHHDPNVRGRPDDYPVEVSEADILPQMFAGVGGSTLHFGAQWPRLLPSDFRVRSLDGVADDWPIRYEELAPYYEQTDRDVGAAGLGGDPAYPAGAPPPLPAHPINEYGRRAAQGMNALGWHWWPAVNAIASRAWGNLEQCARYGTCETGCPHGAKASFDLTHWPHAIRDGARLVPHARVREITLDARGRATGAIYLDRDGTERHVAAATVVLAANGVGTARLLLLSASPQFPDGLANRSGLVGRRLMMHPYAAVIGVYDEQLRSWRGPAGQNVQSLQFYETDTDRGFVRGAKWAVMPTQGPHRMVALLDGRPYDATWGETMQRHVRDAIGRTIEWGVLSEDLPDPENRVLLDPELKDSSGLPAPRVRYRISENTRRQLEWNCDRAREAHAAAGASTTFTTPIVNDQPGHLLGTARMGTDPATSVTDPNGRTHDVPNLYIADGSVFVTAGGVNPTSTISALALRLAEHLAAEAPRQETPS